MALCSGFGTLVDENSIASVTAPSSDSDTPATATGDEIGGDQGAADGSAANQESSASLYSQLDADKVLETLGALRDRIAERFPERGLNKVCAELEAVCSRSRERIRWIARPNWPLRITRYLLLGIILIGVVATLASLRPAVDAGPMTLVEFIQTLEAGINDVVLISVGVFFVWTLEARVKRRRAMASLHELRSIAHVIDMHQLTKDPDRLLSGRSDTKSSPKETLSAFALRRYLDYCSEMLSLTGKVAALHLRTLDDPTVVASVNEIEDLTTGLSRKIWQKIELVRAEDSPDEPS